MKGYKRIICGLLAGMLAASCMGCVKEPEELQIVQDAQAEQECRTAVVSMERSPVIQYTVPHTTPSIFVNQVGYAPGSEIEIPLKGKVLPREFALINAATEEVVLQGCIEQLTFNEEMNIYTGLAKLGEITEEGTYYIKCEKIGYSLPFTIEEEILDKMFYEVYQKMIESCREDTAAVSDIMTLLTAYEWYPAVFPDEDGDKIPDVANVIAEWIHRREEAERDKAGKDKAEGGNAEHVETESDDAREMLYVATLAKFSYLYQKYDWQYASECLQYAKTAFNHRQPNSGKDSNTFCALTELYRLTGAYTYRTQIQEYGSFFEGNNSYLTETSYLYGAMTYLNTRQRVDVDLCRTFMEDIMYKGEEVSNCYEEIIHPTAPHNEDAEDLMDKVAALICCNYVLHNYEYTHTIEEFLHYFCGRNPEAVCLFSNEDDVGNYLLLLTQLVVTEDMR